ncbi:MAG: DUF177 domain-containing protein [Candidatus Firestonebacteria bacterium]
MKIDIKDLKDGVNQFNLNETPEEIGFKPEEAEFEELISSDIEINKIGEKFIVKGKIKTVILLECSRCLEKFKYNIYSNFKLIYAKDEISKYGAVNKEEMDEITFTGDILDVDDDVKQTIILEIPMKPVCKEDCKGLCCYCGQNINSEKCGCKKEEKWQIQKEDFLLQEEIKEGRSGS